MQLQFLWQSLMRKFWYFPSFKLSGAGCGHGTLCVDILVVGACHKCRLPPGAGCGIWSKYEQTYRACSSTGCQCGCWTGCMFLVVVWAHSQTGTVMMMGGLKGSGAKVHSWDRWYSLRQYLQRGIGFAFPVNVSLYKVKSICDQCSDFWAAALRR